LAFATFLVWRLRTGACGVGACGFWRYGMPPIFLRFIELLIGEVKQGLVPCVSLRCRSARMLPSLMLTRRLHRLLELQPTTAQRYRSETELFILEDLFSSVFLQFKNYYPSEKLKIYNLGIFQSLKLRNLNGKNPSNFS